MSFAKDYPDVNFTLVNTGLSGVYLKTFLDPNNTSATQHEITRNMTYLLLGAATKTTKFGIEDANLDINKKDPLLIPVLRGGLPMYVVAQTMFGAADTVLVRCNKTKGMAREKSVAVEWMGRKAFATESDLDGKDILLLDTVVATGDTILKLLDYMKATIETSEVKGMDRYRCITVLTCYASAEGLKAVMGHPLVKGVVVGAIADRVNEMGFLEPSTGGDIGDKLFGEIA